MLWIDIIVALILIFSFIGGIKEGMIKSFFSLVAFLIALPISAYTYHIVANWLSFLPGGDWENFVGFFVTMAVVSIILSLIFIIPRKIIEVIFSKLPGQILFRLVGAVLSLLSAALGLVVFELVLTAFPIFGWLESAVGSSNIMSWLVANLGFIHVLIPTLPEAQPAVSVRTLLSR